MSKPTDAEWTVIDERARPALRERLAGHLLSADAADFAVGRIRLAALDLTEEEIAGTSHWRVLLGELDAGMLLDASEGLRAAPPGGALSRLRGFAASGRLEVRSAGVGAWSPDFAVIRAPGGDACALGAIYFGQPRVAAGPSFTLITRSEAAVRAAAERFQELWERSHDVLPAITEVLGRADGVGVGFGPGGR